MATYSGLLKKWASAGSVWDILYPQTTMSQVINLNTSLANMQAEIDDHTHAISDVAGLQAALDVKSDKTYVHSRGQNLLTNGAAFLGNNSNFSAFTFDGSQAYYSGGSFKYMNSGTVYTDEYMPVNPELRYKLEMFAKSQNAVGRYYAMIACYDVDGNGVTANTHMYKANTLTTLAQPLNNGDTIMYLTNAVNWDNSGTIDVNTHLRSIILWNYVNSFGYAYPPLTYSRKWYGNAWNPGAINYTNNTITLKTPWAGGYVAAGTQLSNGSSGGTFKYLALGYTQIPTSWTYYSGIMNGIDLSGTNVDGKFPPGTAKVRVGWLMNYAGSGETAWFANLSFGVDYGYSAEKLKTPRTINGVSFDGSANITLSEANIGIYRPTNADYWGNKTPIIGPDGVMEVGKYIDFHITDGSTTDFDQRMEANSTGIKIGDYYIVLDNDSRLTNSRPASDVYAWAKASVRPTYTYVDVGAAPTVHNHDILLKDAHVVDADAYNLSIDSADMGAGKELSLRFHHSGRFYKQIRVTESEFKFTEGNNGNLVPIKALELYANGVKAVKETISLAASIDLNTVIDSGFYRVNNGTTNGPSGVNVSWSQMIVSRGNDTIYQMVTQFDTGDTWSRTASGIGSTPVWTGWTKNITVNNLSSHAVLAMYNTSLNSDTRNTRGVTRLYRSDDNSDFSVQTTWTGVNWLLRGFNGDTYHAPVEVGYAANAGTLDGLDSTAFYLATNPNGYITIDHTHDIVDVTGLQTALDAKADSSHTHVLANISDAGAAAAKGVTDSYIAGALGTGTNLVTERDVYYGTPTINGAKTYNSNSNIYAPTSVGSAYQKLISAGSGEPIWADAVNYIGVTAAVASGVYGTVSFSSGQRNFLIRVLQTTTTSLYTIASFIVTMDDSYSLSTSVRYLRFHWYDGSSSWGNTLTYYYSGTTLYIQHNAGINMAFRIYAI